jgi:hypothetical protein
LVGKETIERRVMLNSEDEAFNLAGDDRGSWSARGRAKKAYRNMPATPEEEVPRHRSPRPKKKNHVHKWGEWINEGEEKRRCWSKPRKTITLIKYVRVCKKCGCREQGHSLLGGTIKKGRYSYWY